MRRLYEYAANETHNSPQVSLRTLYRSSIEICLHGAKEKQKPIRYMTIHFQSLARRTGVTETSLKSSRLCVNRSTISYGFRTGARAILPCEQRLHFRGMSWRAKSSYFSHAISYHENVASARRVELSGIVLHNNYDKAN